MREVTTIYGVAETFKSAEPYVVVAVKAEVYRTGYKLRFPDRDPDRYLAMRAFNHGGWVWRHGHHGLYAREDHLLTRDGAIKHFLRGLASDIDNTKERLTEQRTALRRAKRLFR